MLKIMLDGNQSAASRLRDADYVFTHAQHAVEIEDIEARLANLERRAGKQ